MCAVSTLANASSEDISELPLLDMNDRTTQVLGKVFWNLMNHWNIHSKDQALLLGVKYHATKLKEWEKKNIIPQDPDKFRRVGNLAGIHKNLRILFPYNRRAVYDFMTTPQEMLFGGKSPLQIIQEGGEINSYATIAAIRRRLDQLRT
ncbi:MAG: DUF2384 domain-containing protein [Deltaproteobacteria bacterium]|nr:MAG: DUF2384 domain-containing protein [Deltaproteobacteria bacterium]